jgi:16S rRNA (uracil1498-N3)-methyltransferase
MHRFYLPPEQCRTATFLLMGPEAHHAFHVLRVCPGDPVAVLDGVGSEYRCLVQHATRNQVTLRVGEKRYVPPPASQVTLLQALPKGKLIESIIQKATELGVARVVPLIAERCIIQLDPHEAAAKVVKWQSIAIEAIKQCGAAWHPRVETPLSPRQFLERKEPIELSLVGSLQPEARHPRTVFAAFRQQFGRMPKSVGIWIGPEGDFTTNELASIQSAGAFPITLGQLVLRTETATLYCLSILSYELQAGCQ